MKRPICALADLFPGEAWAPAEGHRRRCLRCQAEEARRRGLDRSLAALRPVVEPAPAGLHAAVMSRLGPQDALGPAPAGPVPAALRRRLAPLAAGVGLALAVLAGVALGLARRRARAAA